MVVIFAFNASPPPNLFVTPVQNCISTMGKFLLQRSIHHQFFFFSLSYIFPKAKKCAFNTLPSSVFLFQLFLYICNGENFRLCRFATAVYFLYALINKKNTVHIASPLLYILVGEKSDIIALLYRVSQKNYSF